MGFASNLVFYLLVLLFLSATFYQITTSVLLVRYLKRKHFPAPQIPGASVRGGISVLIPVKGIQWDFSRNLKSILDQDYSGELEVILGVQSESDPVIEYVRGFVKEHASRVEVRFAIGGADSGFNPKNSNLNRAFPLAKFDWIYCSDADVALEASFFSRAMPRMDIEKYGSTFTIHSGSASPGAMLECVGTNVEGAAFFLLTSLMPEKGIMNGAAMLFHRSLLEKIGGIQLSVNQITDDLYLVNFFNACGAQFVLLPNNVRADLEPQKVSAYWHRFVRWLLIARCYRPSLFYSSPTVWIWQWALVATFVFGQAMFFKLFIVAIFFRILFALVFQSSLAGWSEAWKIVGIPLYDVFVPFAWIRAIFIRHVVWAGNHLVVGPNGTLEAKKSGS